MNAQTLDLFVHEDSTKSELKPILSHLRDIGLERTADFVLDLFDRGEEERDLIEEKAEAIKTLEDHFNGTLDDIARDTKDGEIDRTMDYIHSDSLWDYVEEYVSDSDQYIDVGDIPDWIEESDEYTNIEDSNQNVANFTTVLEKQFDSWIESLPSKLSYTLVSEDAIDTLKQKYHTIAQKEGLE